MASMKPNPSVVMSMVVSTDVCAWPAKASAIRLVSLQHLPTHFIVESVKDIHPLLNEYKPHAGRDVLQPTQPDTLFTQASEVEDSPKNEAWAEFIKIFDIKRRETRRGGVERSAHEKL